MVEKIEEGTRYRMTEDLSVAKWCVCDYVLKQGEEIIAHHWHSPNRIAVKAETGFHHVRASTLRQVVEKVPCQGC